MDTFNKHKVWDPHDITHVEKALGELNRILSAKVSSKLTCYCAVFSFGVTLWATPVHDVAM